MQIDHRFIVIDDDPTSNLICQLTLEMTLGKIDIKTFIKPEEGLAYIESEYSRPDAQKAILFLDINMPVMTGWEFLERFDELSDNLKKKITIYILTSSVDPRDKQRSYANKNVDNHLAKPLTMEIIKGIVNSTIYKKPPAAM